MILLALSCLENLSISNFKIKFEAKIKSHDKKYNIKVIYQKYK